jgi:hypothetical protein
VSGELGPDDRLRLDYAQTTDFLRTLTDVRFRLLALVPTVSGVAVALVGHPGSAVELLALGVLGLSATLGILLYELRNSELYDHALRRAQRIEAALGLGLFSERPPASLRLLGLVVVNRDRGLALVYGAALAGWSYLVAWGVLRAAQLGSARAVGAVVGLAVGAILVAELVRIHERTSAEDGRAAAAASRQAPAAPGSPARPSGRA